MTGRSAELGRVVETARAGSWLDRLLRALTFLCALMLLGMTFIVTLDVLVRALSGRPIAGVFEATEVLLIGITFLALAGVQASGRQLSVNILTSQLVGRKRALLALLDGVTAMAFFSILVWTAGIDFLEAYRMGLRGGGLIRIPSVVPLGLILIGSACMLMTLLSQMVRNGILLVSGDPPVAQGTADE